MRLNIKSTRAVFGTTLAFVLFAGSLSAQTAPVPADTKKAAPVEAKATQDVVQQTFRLNNVGQQNDVTDIVTAIRNMVNPTAKIYPVLSQNALVVQVAPDQLVLVKKLLADLDQPKNTYRLTYTVTEMDGGKKIGVQHFAMIVVGGQRTVLKQGSKVPIATGSYSDGKNGSASGAQTQFTYVDMGMNFDATLDEFLNGVRLRTKVEQLSVAEERSGVGAEDPVIRQTSLEGTSFLSVGKPLILGSVDVPGSTRHLDVEVVMELVR